ncbi:uncharacterized protein LOC129945274 [Eupeodes corollae]|uniref:uncharacterized protein LOC129945274 n=1 Tax=Eupeodes corollae TaxID=290404 RepID=UPI002491C414|nr:uncharacterized protein LOC129945274 [Eupeodes corollae]
MHGNKNRDTPFKEQQSSKVDPDLAVDDLKNCNNWRGITILFVFPKLMATIILERIKSKIECAFKSHQAGLRSLQKCVDHINTLRIIIEQYSEYQSALYLMFVDFEKAFDRVSRDVIWRSLVARGIPDKIVAIFSDAFEVRQGVRQGDISSPILFLLAINDVVTAKGEPERLGVC